MTRLVGPVIVLLLMLLAGAAWSIFGPLRLPEFVRGPATETPRPATQTPPSDADPGADAATKQAKSAPAETLPAKFDVARIDPEGTSVFAGRTAPNATVTVLGDGHEVGTAQADEQGEWTMAVDHKFASDDPQLAIVAKRPSRSKEPLKKQSEVAGLAPKKDVPARAASDDVPARAASDDVAARAASDQDKTPAASADSGAQREPRARGIAQREPRARQTARSVTSNLLKNLEAMVETARTTSGQQTAIDPEAPAPAQAEDAAPVAVAAVDASPTDSPAGHMPVVPPASSSATEAAEPRTAPQAPVTSAAPAVRKTIPVPITFVFNESTLTEDGRKAAALLLEYLQIKKFSKVSLTGHADERGSDELNMALSRERLATVERFMRASGFEGELELVPKGESEPFAGVERAEYELEDLYQLDRRVELVISR